MTTVKLPVGLIAAFLWIGFVCAISFLESWLKFRAPGVSLSVGLGIGELMFNALNKIEWVLAIAICLDIIIAGAFYSWRNIFYLITIAILGLQTFWLLPVLEEQINLYFHSGYMTAPEYIHDYYVYAEIVKCICLTIFGLSLFKNVDVQRTDGVD